LEAGQEIETGDIRTLLSPALPIIFTWMIPLDDFRLLGDNDGYYGFVLITPALSPIYGQNP
jgi:hypothetical protein